MSYPKNRFGRFAIALSVSAIATATLGIAMKVRASANDAEADAKVCAEDVGISLPKGFCATVFADKVGHPRQMAVGKDGTLYVNTWSGVYYGNDTLPDGGFLVALKDTKNTGKADVVTRFGPSFKDGGKGGTGIWLHKDWLYAEINDKVVRYAVKDGAISPDATAETILSGMPLIGDHPMHPFAIDAQDNLLVSMGSATNTCEVKNRMPHSPGNEPCVESETRAGVWRYNANKADQVFSSKERFVSGIRNAGGFDFDAAGQLYVTQHGRDQLHENWPKLYTTAQGFELPSEEVMIVKDGAWYGWPKCYYDPVQKKRVLGPEYGGDGGSLVGDCDKAEAPALAFPAHWAPNDIKFYKANAFPKAYGGGAFIAFHGSWNRAPGPQDGYNVVFQPMSNGKPSGNYVIFADGFAGAHKEPGRAAHRPSGLAIAPDGALFVSDDKAGRIWRVTFNGDASQAIEAAPKVDIQANTSAKSEPSSAVALPIPDGATSDDVALGKKIFHGEVAGATCAGCHGADGIGTPVGADLTTGKWLWGDGSLATLTTTIKNGVEVPKVHPGAMPPYGGVELNERELTAVAAYVWAIGNKAKQ